MPMSDTLPLTADVAASASTDNQERVKDSQLEVTQKQEDSKDFKSLKSAFNAERKRAEELNAKLQAYEEEKLKAEGKKDELLAKREKELQELRSQYNTEKRTIVIQNALRSSGANEELIDLATAALLKTVEFSEDNEADSLDEAITQLKSQKASLFTSTAPAVNVGIGISNSSTGSLTVEEAKKIIASGDNILFAKNRDKIYELQKEGKL